MTTNQIAYFSAKEQQRHNFAMEGETRRTNLANERIKTQSNLITESHYTRMDAETMRHNLATEEQAREQLNLGYAQLDLGNRQLQESTRHNMASESLQLQTLSESRRHNVASEKLGVINANESIRHNQEMERMEDEINGSNVVANYAKAAQLNKDAQMKSAQTAKLKAEKTKIEEETKYLGMTSYSNAFRNYTQGTGSLVNSVAPLAY